VKNQKKKSMDQAILSTESQKKDGENAFSRRL